MIDGFKNDIDRRALAHLVGGMFAEGTAVTTKAIAGNKTSEEMSAG